MLKIVCDRCEAQEPVKVTVGAAGVLFKGIPVAKPVLPENWQAVGYPEKDGSRWDRYLCGLCVTALREFFGEKPETTERCVRCGHAPQEHSVVHGCFHCPDNSRCELTEYESTDEGWAKNNSQEPEAPEGCQHKPGEHAGGSACSLSSEAPARCDVCGRPGYFDLAARTWTHHQLAGDTDGVDHGFAPASLETFDPSEEDK